MEENTTITIRVQAKDGMFLGPDSFNGAVIRVSDADSGALLASGITSAGDSGTQVAAANSNTSPYPLAKAGTSTPALWVQADPQTVNFSFGLDLSVARTLDVQARIPLPAAQGDQFATAQLQLQPGGAPLPGVGFVLEVPGLWVQPEIVVDGLQMRIRAKVTMMCGCMINLSSPVWQPAQYNVVAQVNRLLGDTSEKVGSFPMTFQINSQFYVDTLLPGYGSYEIIVAAEQLVIANAGRAKTIVQVSAPA